MAIDDHESDGSSPRGALHDVTTRRTPTHADHLPRGWTGHEGGRGAKEVNNFEPPRRLQTKAALLHEIGAPLRYPRDELQKLLTYHQKMYGTSEGGDHTRALALMAWDTMSAMIDGRAGHPLKAHADDLARAARGMKGQQSAGWGRGGEVWWRAVPKSLWSDLSGALNQCLADVGTDQPES